MKSKRFQWSDLPNRIDVILMTMLVMFGTLMFCDASAQTTQPTTMPVITTIVDGARGWARVTYPGVTAGTMDAGSDEPSIWRGGWGGPKQDFDVARVKAWAKFIPPGEVHVFDVFEDGMTERDAKQVRILLKPAFDREALTGVFGFPTASDEQNRLVYPIISPYLRILTPAYYFGEVSDTLQPREAIDIARVIAATQRLNSKKPIYFVWRAHTHNGVPVSLTKLDQMFDLLIALGVDGFIQWDDAANEHTKAACDLAVAKAQKANQQ